MSFREWIWIAIVGIGWGSSFLFNALLLREIGPLSVSFLRTALGALACWGYVVASGRMVPVSASLLWRVLFLGVMNYSIPLAIYPIGQQFAPAGVAGIVNAMMPIMVVIVSHLWPGGEKATLAKTLGVVFGFAGILVLTVPALMSGEGGEVWAIPFMVLAPLCYAIAMNFLRLLRGYDSAVIAAMALTGGVLAMLPVMLGVEGIPRMTRATTWGALLMLGPLLTGIFFILFYGLVRRVGATNASTVTFIAPVSALVLGHLVLGEEILPSHLLGMTMIFGGLLAIDGRLMRGVQAH